jgi:LysR family transcriptional activator of nhaA
MTHLNLHHLRLFRAVSVAGSMAAAARQLHLSPSALSTQIRALEQALGHALFERRGRRLELTEAGRIALEHAETIFRTADDLADTLRTWRRPQRVLRVGSLSTLSRNFQLAFLRPVLGRRDVEVVLRSGSQGELLRDLATLALDVVLTNMPPPPEGDGRWIVHLVDEQPLALVGSPKRVGPAPVALDRLLAREPLVLPARGTPLRLAFDSLLSRLRLTPRIAAEADDMAMLRLLARADIGLVVIPPIVVRDELVAGTLVEAATLDDIHEQFFAVETKRMFANPLIAELLHAAAERSAPGHD